MLQAYRGKIGCGRLARIELCHKAGERFGIDALYEIYAQRIEAFRSDPPPLNWDGVYEAESK